MLTRLHVALQKLPACLSPSCHPPSPHLTASPSQFRAHLSEHFGVKKSCFGSDCRAKVAVCCGSDLWVGVLGCGIGFWGVVCDLQVIVVMATGHTEKCCEPAPPAKEEHKGTFEKVGGLDTYVTGERNGSAAVVIVSDVFGYNKPLLLKLADKVSAAGFVCYVPDLLHGDPFTGSDFSTFPEWRKNHLPTEEPPKELKKVIQAIKETSKVKSVGVAGCCWGGKVAVIMGKDKELVKAVVQLHPGMVEQTDYEQVAVPIMVLAASTDGVEKHEALLESRKDVPSYVKVFPEVEHGWTVRYDENDANAVQNAFKAHTLMIDWFSTYL